jgi:hypothetical protein
MTHAQMVERATAWLRTHGCGVVLSEQACISGEIPDAIGWKGSCHSVLVECKVTRSDFLIDREKPFRRKPESALGCERFYFAPRGMISISELPAGWGLLEFWGRKIQVVQPSNRKLRTTAGFRHEMNMLLASLRRVEVRIEPQTITDFLKWKNRMATYNGGVLPEGVEPTEAEPNHFLENRPTDI